MLIQITVKYIILAQVIFHQQPAQITPPVIPSQQSLYNLASTTIAHIITPATLITRPNPSTNPNVSSVPAIPELCGTLNRSDRLDDCIAAIK